MSKKFIDFLNSLEKGQAIDYYYTDDEKEEEKLIVESIDLKNKSISLKNPKTNEIKPRYEVDFIIAASTLKWI